MPETQTETPATNVVISFRMEQIIKHMLKNPRHPYCISEMCAELGLLTGTMSPIMRKMEQAGWVTGETESRGRHYPRRWYRFTRGTAPMLRRVIGG